MARGRPRGPDGVKLVVALPEVVRRRIATLAKRAKMRWPQMENVLLVTGLTKVGR